MSDTPSPSLDLTLDVLRAAAEDEAYWTAAAALLPSAVVARAVWGDPTWAAELDRRPTKTSRPCGR